MAGKSGRFSISGNLSRREFLASSALAAGALAVGCSKTGGSWQKNPNILFILADDLGWRDVGFMGSRFYQTPNLDQLAGQGMVFSDAYANAPNCAPTRASLLTGQYSPRHGVYTVNSSERGPAWRRKLVPIPNTMELAPDKVTVAEMLRDAGYSTACIGKWHLGEGQVTGPTGQGFDINIGGFTAGMPRSYFSPYQNPELPDGPPGEYLTDRLTDEAIKYIGAERDKPFFLYLSYHTVHTPIQPRPELVDKYRSRASDGDQRNPEYAAMVEALDSNVGRVLETLDEQGLAEKTVVFFFSDNGGHREFTDNAPLLGGKGMFYEGGIREPLVIRAPGRTTAGSRCSVPVISTDFLPTMLELAGAAPPPGHVLDGVSLAPLLTGGSLEREAIYWHFPAYLEAWGYHGPHDEHWRATPCGVVRSGRWKLIEYFEDWSVELFDLENDIGETANLADVKPEIRDQLRTLLHQWRQSTGAPVPSEPNPAYDPVRAGK